MDIDTKIQEIAIKVHFDDPLFTEKHKCNEEMHFYNRSIADAENEIKLRNDRLKEMEKTITKNKERGGIL